MGWRCLS